MWALWLHRSEGGTSNPGPLRSALMYLYLEMRKFILNIMMYHTECGHNLSISGLQHDLITVCFNPVDFSVVRTPTTFIFQLFNHQHSLPISNSLQSLCKKKRTNVDLLMKCGSLMSFISPPVWLSTHTLRCNRNSSVETSDYVFFSLCSNSSPSRHSRIISDVPMVSSKLHIRHKNTQ